MKREYLYNTNLDILKVKVPENQPLVTYYHYRDVDHFLPLFESTALTAATRISVLDSVYSTNTSNNFNDVFTTRRN